jgi:hypothetical protein
VDKWFNASTVREPNKKPSPSGKSENEGISKNPEPHQRTGWPHPSLCGEVAKLLMVVSLIVDGALSRLAHQPSTLHYQLPRLTSAAKPLS